MITLSNINQFVKKMFIVINRMKL